MVCALCYLFHALQKKTMLHKRSRINFTLDTLDDDKYDNQANAPISILQNIKKRSFS